MTEKQRRVGRYELFGAIASGGMATVHLARLQGPIGFSRTVAVKQLHRRFANDPHVYEMLVDEARIAGRIQHPNVLSTLDVVSEGRELFLVMDYVAGESLSHLMRELARQKARMPLPVVASIAASILYGLHAAHDTKNQRGEHLQIVHRDVSPQNVIVGVDGVTRVIDFGIAKATQRIQRTTLSGQVKGKMGYMAPEQIAGEEVDRRTDLWAASVVLWEMLTGKRLFGGGEPTQALLQIVRGDYAPPSSIAPDVPAAVDAIVLKGLARDPGDRFQTAREMALAIEEAVSPATHREVGELVERMAGTALGKRASQVSELEMGATTEIAAMLPDMPASPKRRRTSPVWIGAAVLVVLLGAALLMPWAATEPPANTRPAEAPDPAPPPIAAVAERPREEVAPVEPTPAAPTAVPSGVVQSSSPPPLPPAAAPSPKLPPPPAEPPPLDKPGTDCSRPFYFERVGDKLIKKWKPECL